MKSYYPKVRSLETSPYYPTQQTNIITEVVDDIPITKTICETIVPIKVNEGLKVKDFALANLLTNGSVDLLRPSSIIKNSNLTVADTVNNL